MCLCPGVATKASQGSGGVPSVVLACRTESLSGEINEFVSLRRVREEKERNEVEKG